MRGMRELIFNDDDDDDDDDGKSSPSLKIIYAIQSRERSVRERVPSRARIAFFDK